jgi:hypothetical protein
MENFYVERTRVNEVRKRDAKKNMQDWFHDHPDFREAYLKASKQSDFSVGRFVSRWKKEHGDLS